MADIFISYAREDGSRAKLLAKALEDQGWSVWWDRRIPAGSIFATVIERELETARCILVLWTKSSVGSNWVQEEADDGLRRGNLLPILLEDVRLPMGFRRIQPIDLVGWQGDPQHPGLKTLLDSIGHIVPREVEIEQPVLDFGDVFISYARKDRGYVKRLIAYLEEAGLSVWADNRIDYGEKWWRTIVGNLRSCLAMVVVMSPAAEASKWVDREILLADELEKPFFPLLLHGERFPIFVGTQYHDVRDGSMPPKIYINSLKKATQQ